MIDRGKHNILGIRISAVDYEAAVAQVAAAATARRPLTVSALAVHAVMTGALGCDPSLSFEPVRLVGSRRPTGPLGTSLALRNSLARPGLWAYLDVGNLPARRTRAIADFPLRKFRRDTCRTSGKALPADSVAQDRRGPAGQSTTAFRPTSAANCSTQFAERRRGHVRGAGLPAQDIWGFECHRVLSMPVISVGAAFNFHAGRLPQAPKLLQDNGWNGSSGCCTSPAGSGGDTCCSIRFSPAYCLCSGSG